MFRPILLLLLMTPAPVFAADKVYKSVDEHGNVTYSSQPPATGGEPELIDVPPPPSEEAQRHAEEEAQKVKQRAKELEKERKAREAEQAAAAAAAAPQGGTTVVIPVPMPSVVDGPWLVPNYPGRPMPPDQRPVRPRPRR